MVGINLKHIIQIDRSPQSRVLPQLISSKYLTGDPDLDIWNSACGKVAVVIELLWCFQSPLLAEYESLRVEF